MSRKTITEEIINPFSQEAKRLYEESRKSLRHEKYKGCRDAQELHERIITVVKAMANSYDRETKDCLYRIFLDLLPEAEDLDEGLR